MTDMTTAVSSTGQPVPPDVPPPVTTSSVAPRTGSTRGAMAHRAAPRGGAPRPPGPAPRPAAGDDLERAPPHRQHPGGEGPPRRRGAARRELPGHPAGGGGAPRQAPLEPVPAAGRRGGPGARRL